MYRRISIQVDDPLYERINRCFEWGERNRVLCRVLEWLCEKIEQHGKNALVMILRDTDFNSLVQLGRTEVRDGDDK